MWSPWGAAAISLTRGRQERLDCKWLGGLRGRDDRLADILADGLYGRDEIGQQVSGVTFAQTFEVRLYLRPIFGLQFVAALS